MSCSSKGCFFVILMTATVLATPCSSQEVVPPPAQPDPFNFSGPSSSGKTLDTDKNVDPRIRVTIEPVVRGPVVDRLTEPVIIHVEAPRASQVELYFEPVDAPYGGRPIGESQLIGKSKDRIHRFPVRWMTPEPHRYVKVYAVCSNGQTTSRSKAIDMGLGGRFLKSE